MTERERIHKLLDPGTFSEVGILNQSDIRAMKDKMPADGNIAGFGKINGRTVLVYAADRTVLAGVEGRVGSYAKETRANREAVENLILAGAFDVFGQPKRQLLWDLGLIMKQEPGTLPLVMEKQKVSLPEMSPIEETVFEYKVQGAFF